MTRLWTSDPVFPEFDCTVLPLPAEDDGDLVATVVRKVSDYPSRRAFLYVHGYVDYFFHEHVANAVCDAGFDFYAIDLRRYGRSLRGKNRPNYCTGIEQYFTEITQAIDIAINEDGHDSVVLYGHSTGGLIVSHYANGGERRANISAVVLNSPFLEFAISKSQRVLLSVAMLIGGIAPWLADGKGLRPEYGQSIHSSELGEWSYDLRWKPIRGFPTYFGWARAIKRAQAQVQRGLSIQQPVLVMHSDASISVREWDENVRHRDAVLNVDDMRRYSSTLGKNVKRVEIPGAIHDIMLSQQPARELALRTLVQWMQETVPDTNLTVSPSLA